MHYRYFDRRTRQKIRGLAPLQVWMSLGLSIVLTGAIIGVAVLWPSKAGQASTSYYQGSSEIQNNMELISKSSQPGWMHMPGSELDDAGINIRPVPFVIVEQDGSGGQPNPSVNLYGAHLEVAGDFKIRASLQDLADGKAHLSLYGQVPIIADEFRYERGALQLTFDGAQLSVQTWEDGHAGAIKTFVLSSTNTNRTLDVVRQDGLLALSVDGATVGSIPEGGIFRGGNVWFGASAEGDSWRLSSLQATRHNNADIRVADSSKLKVTTAGVAGLQQLANVRRPGFKIGAAVALGPLVSDKEYAQLALGGNFGSFTTENALKWQFVHPTPTEYDFHEADAIVDVAVRHSIQLHGHPLVFGEANPAWVSKLPTATPPDKQYVERIMFDHINTVMGRYAGKIATWDVVNEPLADYDAFEAGKGPLRDHIWYRAMGKDYITKAFQAARLADPNARLFINEYGLEDDGERWDEMYNLVKSLKEQGVPIDGVGFQAHVYEADDRISASTLRSHIQALAKLGLQSRISEMDVYSEDGRSVQAKQYSSVLGACLQEASCVSFTTWGISDRYNMFRDDDGSVQTGDDFLWDEKSQPTKAVNALRLILK